MSKYMVAQREISGSGSVIEDRLVGEPKLFAQVFDDLNGATEAARELSVDLGNGFVIVVLEWSFQDGLVVPASFVAGVGACCAYIAWGEAGEALAMSVAHGVQCAEDEEVDMPIQSE